ncbi:MAG: LapA family protein [Erythrobacter sp.]
MGEVGPIEEKRIVRILRTILSVLAALGFLIFAIYNWSPVEITLWQNLVMETKLPVLALLAFALGFVPLWAYHQSVKWGLNRRIRALENSLKRIALARHHEPHPHATVPVDAPVDKPAAKASHTPDPLLPANSAPDAGAGE